MVYTYLFADPVQLGGNGRVVYYEVQDKGKAIGGGGVAGGVFRFSDLTSLKLLNI